MKLGYARVFTEDQTLQLQRPRLKEAGCEKVFEEKILLQYQRRRPQHLPAPIERGDLID